VIWLGPLLTALGLTIAQLGFVGIGVHRVAAVTGLLAWFCFTAGIVLAFQDHPGWQASPTDATALFIALALFWFAWFARRIAPDLANAFRRRTDGFDANVRTPVDAERVEE
jgi:succinate-acetate transporter protein